MSDLMAPAPIPAPMAPMADTAPSPGSATPPGVTEAGGFPFPEGKEPKKGRMPVKVIASIQAVYAREAERQERLAGVAPSSNLALQPGWGGQGR